LFEIQTAVHRQPALMSNAEYSLRHS